MTETTNSIINFIQDIFKLFINLIQQLLGNSQITDEIKYFLIGLYCLIFLSLFFLIFSFLKFVIQIIVKGIFTLFKYITESLNNPQSIPYISTLVLVRSVPWYFHLLLIILVFCGIAALITGGSAWTEAFKYILGATVGSLIGVVRKSEDIEFEKKIFDKISNQPPEVKTNDKGKVA